MERNHDCLPEVALRELLREKRQQKGYTQLKLSILLDNSKDFVYSYESGKRFLSFIEVLYICQILGVDAVEITRNIARYFDYKQSQLFQKREITPPC